MIKKTPDIAIFGAGIAGLWLLARLRRAGYDAVLLETNAIGGGQSIAAQGIIHSGLKYTLAGKVNKLARRISAMPERWRAALQGQGELDLTGADIAAESQNLLIPKGIKGSLIKTIGKSVLGTGAREIVQAEWPQGLKKSGFKGTIIQMNEPVLDIPSVIKALAKPHQKYIRKIDSTEDALETIDARLYIFTAASSNHYIAHKLGHAGHLKTQARPLLMGMMKGAPFPLYAHLAGASEKPVATVTTHKMHNGPLVWYLGGQVAERSKKADPRDIFKAVHKALKRYLPKIDLSAAQWAALPIDRVEGQSRSKGWMPDTPVIHTQGKYIYCWPTKLTFAPLLADKVEDYIQKQALKPSGRETDWTGWPEPPYAQTPWDRAQWTK